MANRRGKTGSRDDFIFWGSKITADGDCSHEIKRCSLLGRIAIRNLNNVLKKQRHHFANEGSILKGMVFPVVMYDKSWTTKVAACQRNDAFKLWC